MFLQQQAAAARSVLRGCAWLSSSPPIIQNRNEDQAFGFVAETFYSSTATWSRDLCRKRKRQISSGWRRPFSSTTTTTTTATTTASSTPYNTRTRQISFLTDVEGDAAYFDRFVANSRILCFEPVTPNTDINNGEEYFPYTKQVAFCDNPDHYEYTNSDDDDDSQQRAKSILVYGGDVCDKGGSDLYILRQLLSLYRRYPGRVCLLMGNRDINKMRIVPEMGLDGDDASSLPYHGGCWWLAGTGLDGDPLLENANAGQSKVPSESPADRLRWILGKTMGSPDAFELRRKELETEELFVNNSARNISDEEVVQSFRKACSPDGELGQYLSSAHLVFKMGAILFMHGALPRPEVIHACQKESLWSSVDYAIPWIVDPQEEVQSVDSWIECLNSFAHEQVILWRKSMQHFDNTSGVWTTVGGYNTAFDYGNLLQFGMGWLPSRRKNPTIVYSSWLNDGMPQQFYVRSSGSSTGDTRYAEEVAKFFSLGNLQLIVSGHQPHGDHPTPIRISRSDGDAPPQYILPCDTSYSADTRWICSGSGEKRISKGRGSSVSGRGDVAVCEVLIDQCIDSDYVSSTVLHGVLSDGSKFESVNLFDVEEDSDLSLVGTLLDRKDFVFEGSVRDDSGEEMDWWVKSKLTDGSFLVSTGKGYEVSNSFATRRI
mmetsp:Transcript_26481/g.58053  ORF Transcript_26481/g.58053 Transcript_26481/m.58053 type:complete len:658 (-) Transcript_26481:32-2005(-)